MQETSDIDLLVVLPDGDPIDWRAWRFDIDEAIGYEPRADAVVAFEENVRAAAAMFSAVRIRDEHQVDIVVVQQPCGVGIGAVCLDQVLGEAGHQLGRGVLPGVKCTRDERCGLLLDGG